MRKFTSEELLSIREALLEIGNLALRVRNEMLSGHAIDELYLKRLLSAADDLKERTSNVATE